MLSMLVSLWPPYLDWQSGFKVGIKSRCCANGLGKVAVKGSHVKDMLSAARWEPPSGSRGESSWGLQRSLKKCIVRLYFWYYIFIGYVFALLFVIDLLRSGWSFIYHNETDNPNQTQFSLLYTFRVGVRGLRFVNHESISWSHEPKISKTSLFQELFFLKNDNFKIIGTDDIALSICLELK